MSDDDSEGDGADAGTGDMNVFEESPYTQDLHLGPHIPHYYGDYVRQLFMLCAAAMLIFSPFLTQSMPGILPFEIGGAIVVAILGALTNPVKQLAMLANILVSGFGVLAYEMIALNSFAEGASIAFIEREALAVGFLFALYFSVKTWRNMILHTIGRKNVARELIDGNNKN